MDLARSRGRHVSAALRLCQFLFRDRWKVQNRDRHVSAALRLCQSLFFFVHRLRGFIAVAAVGQPFEREADEDVFFVVVFLKEQPDVAVVENGERGIGGMSGVDGLSLRPGLPLVVAQAHGHIAAFIFRVRIGKEQAVLVVALFHAGIADEARVAGGVRERRFPAGLPCLALVAGGVHISHPGPVTG